MRLWSAALILLISAWGCAPQATAGKADSSDAASASLPIEEAVQGGEEPAEAPVEAAEPDNAEESAKPAGSAKTEPVKTAPAEPAPGKPAPAGSAKAAEAGGKALAVKMTKGQSLKYKVEMDQVIEPGQGEKQAMAFSMTQVYTVKKAGAKEAELEQKVSDYKIGEKTAEAMRPSISGFLDNLKSKPVVVVVKANGEMKGRAGQGSMTGVPGGGGFMGLVLPKQPLAAGLSWSHSQDLAAGGQTAEMKNAILKTTFTVKSMDAGKGTAVIAFKTTGSPESSSTAKMPPQEGQEAKEVKVSSRTEVTAEGTMTVRLKDLVVTRQDLKTTVNVEQTMDGRSQKMTMRQTQKSTLL